MPAGQRSASDPRSIRRQERLVRDLREAGIQDIKATLQHDYARRWLWRILEMCGTFRSVSANSSAIYQNAAQQDIGLDLVRDIRAADPALMRLLQEEADAREARAVVTAEARETASAAEMEQ
jgi:hypothetical protein